MQQSPRIYFSFRSPYSWLAMRTLAKRGLGIGSELEHLPFFEPDANLSELLASRNGRCLYAPMSKAKHHYILGDVKRLCKAQGIAPRWPHDIAPDWSIPHRTFLACGTAEEQRQYAWSALDARWLRGECIWNWQQSLDLLQRCMPAIRAQEIIESARSARVLEVALEVLLQAYRDDVFGVPFLISRREKFWGHDRVDAFLNHYQDEMARTRSLAS